MITAVHPAARAAPSLRVIIADGKFHGVNIELHTGQKQFKWFRSNDIHNTFVRRIRIYIVMGESMLVRTDRLFDDNIASIWDGRWDLFYFEPC